MLSKNKQKNVIDLFIFRIMFFILFRIIIILISCFTDPDEALSKEVKH